MLSQTLRSLERDGYLSRQAYPTVPPKVEYTLAALGLSLLEKLEPLFGWADENYAKVREAREAYVPPPAATPL